MKPAWILIAIAFTPRDLHLIPDSEKGCRVKVNVRARVKVRLGASKAIID